MADTWPPANQKLFPFLYVQDVRAYLDFLVKAFGFEERAYHADKGDPEHAHGEATLGGSLLMIGCAAPKWGTIAPHKLAALPSAVYAIVDDVDDHCRRARAAGAHIKEEPAERPWGDRMYTARDPQGHEWYFATPQSARV